MYYKFPMWFGRTAEGKRSVAVLAGMLALALAGLAAAGCGSGAEELTAKQASHRVILPVSQLPSGTKVAKKPLLEETCSPASYFRPYAEAVAVTPGFLLPKHQLVQQVGIFHTHHEAERAFREITSDDNRECIARQMQSTAVALTGQRGRLLFGSPPREIAHTTSRTIAVRLINPFGWVDVESTVLLNGRGLTTLTFVSKGQRLPEEEWRSIAASAAGTLSGAVASLAD